MKKRLPVVISLIALAMIAHPVHATIVFHDYQTPSGFEAYAEYLGSGSGSSSLSSNESLVFYHKPPEDTTVRAVAVFINTWDLDIGKSFDPDLSTLSLLFSDSGNTYSASESVLALSEPDGNKTWQINFLTQENLSADTWHRIEVLSNYPNPGWYKVWLAASDFVGSGLRGDFTQGMGHPRPIAVFFRSLFESESKPSYRPVVLIHGLGGKPSDWEAGGNKAVYRERILEKYGSDPSGFVYPETWIHALSYGFNESGKYRYQDDISDIAPALVPVMQDLHWQSLSAGGDGLVDIVGFSYGGLVAREYLRQNPQQKYTGKVVAIAAPHQGSYLLDLKDQLAFALEWGGLLIDEALTEALKGFSAPDQPLDSESLAMQGLLPNSAMLMGLNLDPIAPSGGFFTLGADINATFKQEVFGFEFAKGGKVGDLLVSKDSSLDIPNLDETQSLFESEAEFNLGFFETVDGKYARKIKELLDSDPNWRFWHGRMIVQPEVVGKAMQILGS